MGNAQPILFCAMIGLALLAPGHLAAQVEPAVTSVTLVEKAGVTTVDYPVTLSLVFRQGDVPCDAVTARVADQALPTQTDVKVRYPDGSIKHALVSFLLPSLPASGQAIVEILAGGANANTQPVTLADLLASDFEAAMTVTVGGVPTTITARQMAASPANVQMWLEGDVCSEFLIRDPALNVNNQINVQYRVRMYRGYGGIRIDTVVENTWCNFRGNLTYDFSLALGQSSPAVVLARTGFAHNYCARWRKVLWQGGEPPAVQVEYDLAYLIRTKLIGRYDTSLVVPESTMSGAYSSYLSTNHDIMGSGVIYRNMGDVAGRQDIGLLPTWTVRYLLTMDDRMKEITINAGEMSGSCPIHFRESDPARSFYGRIITIDDRPTIWLNWWDYPYAASADRMPAPVGSTSTGWAPDMAHQPSLAYVPYLVTGDYYFLEEMWFWASWNLASSNWEYRQRTQGILQGQTRGIAWGIRNIADAASLSPDGTPEKAYLSAKVDNNTAYWQSTYVNGNYPAIRFLRTQYNGPGDAPDGSLDSTCHYYTSTWMDDFVLLAAGHLRDIGFDGGPMVDWLGESIINRFRHPDFNWFRGAPYHMPTHGRDPVTGAVFKYATWKDVNDAYKDNVGPSDFVNPDYPYSYNYIARGALTRAAHLSKGRAAWQWLDSHLYSKGELNRDPTWAFVPPTTGDLNEDDAVNAIDLLIFAHSWGLGAGEVGFNPACDFNGDDAVNAIDLLTFARSWAP